MPRNIPFPRAGHRQRGGRSRRGFRRPRPGTVENVVYFGTDTIYHLRTADEQSFTVRMQNREGAASAFGVGGRLGIEIPDGALQVLRD
jgi:hypothetical protein